ncbi:sulfotransferase family protein [Thiocystis violacea]|uniref:sulfotransferase family protein n=1 Tax=Thiocystis violacea TaxID=13725 RepID=UPI001904B356|nr:sulfotransferase [Thiocystis violacea]MBK1717506.1 hypothetical protein [Thiocystis violacea]
MLDSPRHAMPAQSNEPFFLIGSPRSGTTLLVQILNRHSRLFIPPETDFFYYLNLYGFLKRPFREIWATRFLDLYVATRSASMLGLSSIPGLKPRLLENVSSYQEMFVRLMVILNEPSGKPRWGEKTPHHLHAADMIMALFPNAPMIAIVRDGRAVTRSRLQKQNWEQNLFGAALIWRKDSRRLMRLMRDHDERILVIRYEDLVSSPKVVISRVCAFLGEEFQPGMMDSANEVETRFEAYYRQSWMAKSKDAIDPSRTEAWRATFSDRELSLIHHVQQEDLRYWGYEVEGEVSGGDWRWLLLREQLRHGLYRVKRRLAIFSKTHAIGFSRKCA